MLQELAHGASLTVESHVELSSSLQAEWHAFTRATKHHHPHQDIRFSDVARAEGYGVVYVTGRDQNGALRAVGLFSIKPLPLLLGSGLYAYCRDGPICDDADLLVLFLELTIQLSAFAKVGRLRVAPCWADTEAVALQSALVASGWITDHCTGRWGTGWVDISPTPDEILGALSKSARREIRRAQRVGVSTRRLTSIDEAQEFLRSLNRLRQSRGLRPVSETGFELAFRSFYGAGQEGAIIGAYSDDRFLAGLQVHRSSELAHAMHFVVEPVPLHDLSNLRIAP